MSENDLTLEIEGKKIIIESGTLVKTMDTGADAFTAVMPWELGADRDLDKLTAFGSFSEAKVLIGKNVESELILYDITQRTDSGGTTKELEFWSKTADIIDSTILPPYEANSITLTDRCKKQCEPFGIEVIVGEDAAEQIYKTRRTRVRVGTRKTLVAYTFDSKLNAKPLEVTTPIFRSKYITDEVKLPRVKAEPTDKIFSHLSSLAAQRGLLLSCTRQGDLLVTKARTDGEPVGTIEENKSFEAGEYSLQYRGRDRYKTYRAIVKSSSSSRVAGQNISTDESVLAPRLLTFSADDNVPGGAKNSANWRRNKTAADALSLDFPVNSWYAPNGTLWQPNTLVTIISPTMGIKKGFTFLITQVSYSYSAQGSTAMLTIKPPSLYTDGKIEEPWSE